MKKLLSAFSICISVVVLFVMFAFNSAAYAGTSIATAGTIAFDETYSDSITETNREDYYKINLASSGRLTINFNSFMQYYCLYIYDESGAEVWKDEENEWVSTTGKRSDKITVDLTKGCYFLRVIGDRADGWEWFATGNYNFEINFLSSNETVDEPNNSILESKKINFSKTIKGQIAVNDLEDYYKIVLSASGRLNIKFNSFLKYYCLFIYDDSGKEIWKDEENEWISTTGKRSDNITVDLIKGNYYLRVIGDRAEGWDWLSTGNYNFKIDFSSANETLDEPNNNIAESKRIGFNKTVKGQIAVNDSEDYYEINLTTSGKLNIVFNSYMKYYCLYIYDDTGAEIWKDEENEWISTTGKRSDNITVDLIKGNYYLRVTGDRAEGWDWLSTGNYNFTISPEVNVAKVSNLKAAVSTSVVKLSWNKISGVSGYVVYKYNTSTKKYEKVATTKNTSYKITKLKSGTSYKFRVRAYKKAYSKNYYGAYATLSTATKPITPTVKLSTSNKTATVAWNKVNGASGYVVYMSTSKNGTYKKIGTTSKLSYKKTGLVKGKIYYFKVRAYKKVNGVNIYGAYSPIKSVKIK